jgi:hypothetical protein
MWAVNVHAEQTEVAWKSFEMDVRPTAFSQMLILGGALITAAGWSALSRHWRLSASAFSSLGLPLAPFLVLPCVCVCVLVLLWCPAVIIFLHRRYQKHGTLLTRTAQEGGRGHPCHSQLATAIPK